ncbi:hypothetical protein AB0M43_11810 [Longispora sp. NPDC051575]|uniref:NACHT domain-containing protein n=1 Tax=Longispora sp. NPDC051575 TaxID=3154943 RepID=UPI003417901F
MRREPAVTLRGALKILGHHDRPWLDRINAALGGAILAGGVGAVASGALPVLAAGGVLAAVWGWVDQKNEAAGLLRRCLDGISDRLSGTRGYERHQLIVAAHTTIVISAYLEVLREHLGRPAYRSLALTDRTLAGLAMNTRPGSGDRVTAQVYEAAVPAPSAARGFEENLAFVTDELSHLDVAMFAYLHRPVVSPSEVDQWDDGRLAERAADRYRSHFLTLAATVPEFMIWASLGEHAATRNAVAGTRQELAAALNGHGRALSRVEDLLRLCAPPGTAVGGPLETLRRTNRSVLDAPVIDADTARLDSGITFPAIGRSYVDPRYRVTRYQAGVRPADESQWEECPVHDDVDLLVTGHVVSPDATRLPLLLLGHPGAGKSLLTKVLAARLPSASFTVVRVPLRRVGANVPVYRQIQEALDLVTHERVSWSDLAEQSADTVRVVLLDGLDELLQATANDRTGYLREVAEFQRAEAVQDRPVIVVVTSRTVVADRVEIPTGTPIVRLEAFDDGQIRTWVAGWHEANADQIRAGQVRGVPVDTALELRHLAQQPVLLLMLALYCADPHADELDAELSEAQLLQRLLQTFAVREVRKRAPGRLVGAALDEAVGAQLRRLSIAALGMFNRGRQDIAEEELGMDLTGLGVPLPEGLRTDELGQRVLGEFFFLHTAEAKTLRDEKRPRRRYEFLHATFGEYLVAAYVVDTLADVADAAFGGRRERDPQDDLLFALLSHEPLAIQQPLLTFIVQLVTEMEEAEQRAMIRTVEILIRRYRSRQIVPQRAGYRPSEPDQVRQLAAFWANLVLLRLALSREGGFALAALWPEHSLAQWRSMVTLWRAGLDSSGWRSMLSVVVLEDGHVFSTDSRDVFAELDDVRYAMLLDDSAFTARLRIGTAVRDGAHFTSHTTSATAWFDGMVDTILAEATTNDRRTGPIFKAPPADVAPEALRAVTKMLCWLASSHSERWDIDETVVVVRWLLRHGDPRALDPYCLALLICRAPAILTKVPDLRDPKLYRQRPGATLLLVLSRHVADGTLWPLLDELIAELSETGPPALDTIPDFLGATLDMIEHMHALPPNLRQLLRSEVER